MAAIRANFEMMVIVFLLVARTTRTQCLVVRC
jgi:hypothetical protein